VGQPQAVESADILERGAITFFHRPRVERDEPEDLSDVQRLLIVLAPDDSEFERLIVIGRQRIPESARRERFWGFVDLHLTSYDMSAALSAHVYRTATRGVRHLPAARPLASGHYELTAHRSHTHLRWWLTAREHEDAVAQEIDIEPAGDYIVTVANPAPAVWGLADAPDLQATLFDELETHITVPNPFPPALQQRFRGNRYAPVDSAEWLDHPGSELVFVGTGDSPTG
jgi:hypothetical protein